MQNIQDNTKMTKTFLRHTLSILLLFGVAVGIVGPAFAELRGQPASLEALLLPEPWPLEPFTLLNHQGKEFTQEYLKGKWTFVVFGESRCTDPCEKSLTALAQMYVTLSKTDKVKDSQVLLVAVDPHSDTLQRLAEHLSNYDDRFIGVTGTSDALEDFASEMGISYTISASQAGHEYKVEYSDSSVSLVDPELRLQAYFPAPHHPATLTADYLKLRSCQ